MYRPGARMPVRIALVGEQSRGVLGPSLESMCECWDQVPPGEVRRFGTQQQLLSMISDQGAMLFLYLYQGNSCLRDTHCPQLEKGKVPYPGILEANGESCKCSVIGETAAVQSI